MHLAGAAAFHLKDCFEGYDFENRLWAAGTFKGKIEYAQESFSINDLSTRKRMLVTPKGVKPTSSVIRLKDDDVFFMVEGLQRNVFHTRTYQYVYNIHEVRGAAIVRRLAPTGDLSNPGWAVNSVVENTFGDCAFARVPMDQERSVNQYGLYTIYLPSDSLVKDKDTVEIDGVVYYVFEVYWDQGLRACRATNTPDMRQNIVYTTITQGAYNSSTLNRPKVQTNYNVTAQVAEPADSETNSGTVADDKIRVLIGADWIPVVPQLGDQITWGGKVYRVMNIKRNMIQDQWELECSV